MARPDAQGSRVVEEREGGVDRLPVHHWLPHAHEHDVRDLDGRVEQAHLTNLAGDLVDLEVAAEPHGTSGAEGAAEGTAGL